jgi:hypothetical protein
MTVRTALLGGLAVCAAATAAILLNLLLLGHASARNDPVGRLTPRTRLPAAPRWTIRPARGRVTDGGADD